MANGAMNGSGNPLPPPPFPLQMPREKIIRKKAVKAMAELFAEGEESKFIELFRQLLVEQRRGTESNDRLAIAVEMSMDAQKERDTEYKDIIKSALIEAWKEKELERTASHTTVETTVKTVTDDRQDERKAWMAVLKVIGEWAYKIAVVAMVGYFGLKITGLVS